MKTLARPTGVMMPRLLCITAIAETQLQFLRGQNVYLAGKGFEIHSCSSGGPAQEILKSRDSCIVHSIEISRRGASPTDLLSLWRLFVLLKTVRPSVVYLGTPKAALLGAVAATLAQVPVRVFVAHGMISPHLSGWRKWIFGLAEWLTCRLATQTLFVSHSLESIARENGICLPYKGKTLLHGTCNGIDVDRFNPTRVIGAELPEGSTAGPIIGFVGRLVKDKGVEVLVQAWRVLRVRYPQCRLLIVGAPEKDDAVSSSIMRELVMDPRVIMTGYVSDVAPYYKIMSVLAFPTFREGFPYSPMEAGAMEVPVVASRVVGCVDAVIDGVTGTLIPPRNSLALIEAVSNYLDNPLLAREHGRKARERVIRDFNPEDVWEATYKEYVRLLEAQGLSMPDSALEYEAVIPGRKAA